MKPSLQTEPKCTPISTWKRHFSEYGPQNASRPQTVRNGSTTRLVRKLGVNYLETCTGIWQNNFISDEHFLEIHRNIFEILCTIHCLFFFWLCIFTVFYKCIYHQPETDWGIWCFTSVWEKWHHSTCFPTPSQL